MVWYIVSIVTHAPSTSILFNRDTETVNQTGPLAGNYVLAFPGLGYVTLTDKGNTGALKVTLYELLMG
jgi:hypothetical protein